MQPAFLHRSSAQIPKGGGGYDSILRTILTYLCITSTPKESHGTMPPLNTPLIITIITKDIKMMEQ